MSRPRRYRTVAATNALGEAGWSIEGECLSPECSEPHERWGLCGHWLAVLGWWPARELAEAQAATWQHRQALILAGDTLGPVAA